MKLGSGEKPSPESPSAGLAQGSPKAGRGRARGARPSSKKPKTSGAKPKQQQLGPTDTAFDLLGGVYAKARKARLVVMTTAGAAAAALVLVAATAAMTLLGVREQQNHLERLAVEKEQLELEFSKVANIGGVTIDQIDQFLAVKGPALASTASNDIAVSDVVTELRRRLPPSATLEAVAITSGGEAGTTVTISATVQRYEDVKVWESSTEELQQLVDPVTTWSGSPPELAVTTTATLSDAARTQRARDFMERFGATIDAEQGAPAQPTPPPTEAPEGGQ